jgi:hypothetical protein
LLHWAARATEIARQVKAVLHEDKTFDFTAEGWAALVAVSNSGRAKGKLVMEMPA